MKVLEHNIRSYDFLLKKLVTNDLMKGLMKILIIICLIKSIIYYLHYSSVGARKILNIIMKAPT